jgi:hypothetical protein
MLPRWSAPRAEATNRTSEAESRLAQPGGVLKC